MFKRVVGSLLVGLLMTVGVRSPVLAQNTQNFDIRSFTSEYYVNRTPKKTATMTVDETVVAVFPDYDQNHGILRAIPETYKGLPLDVNVTGVTDEADQSYAYTSSEQNGNLVLKIGSPNSYVHGVKTYHITYTLKDQISFYQDHDELYWDVNGDQWQQPFGEVTARVHIPDSIDGDLQQRQACYTGAHGSTAQDCTIDRAGRNGETLVTIKAPNLSPNQTLTFVLSFNKGTFAIDQTAVRMKQLKRTLTVLVGVLPPILTLAFVISRWRKYGRDPKGRGVIVPQYTPWKGLNALTSDVILQEEVRSQAITALIIELAIKGYIAIYEVEKKGLLRKSSDYELELCKTPNSLSQDETSVVNMVFGDGASVGTRVKISDLKNKLATKFKEIAQDVPAHLFEQGYFTNDPTKTTKRYGATGGVITILGFLGLFFVGMHIGLIAVVLPLSIILSGIIVTSAAKAMPARSDKGVEVHDYLLGLNDYIQLAEAERIKYLQSPEGVKQYGSPDDPKTKIKLFERLLPYAMLFGLEKDWAKQFKDIYKEAPDWYHGNWSTFNTIYLVNSIGSFSTSSGVAFAPPSSSGSSGFGGGGFSGGGGGGGGGGGW